MTKTINLAKELISKTSITPQDAGCMEIIQNRLEPRGFQIEYMNAGEGEHFTKNLWAIKKSQKPNSKTLVFAGHTDVVPTGPLERWQSPPFEPTEKDGYLYGRGASDMKTSIAAFIVACEEFLEKNQDPAINIAFLLTSDEEGPANHGTKHVCEKLKERGEKLDFCIVGEPTAQNQTGDMIKNGRRGSMSGKLTVHGKQGHIAYPHLAKNPIHMLSSALALLCEEKWDNGNQYFPPTSFQCSNIKSGTGASNIIPADAILDFNFRFSTQSSIQSLQSRVEQILEKGGLKNTEQTKTYTLDWTVSGEPFITTAPANEKSDTESEKGSLISATQSAIKQITNLETELSTSGGTSDGRFIAKICPQVIELGPPNASIHQINENIKIADIAPLTKIYEQIIINLNNNN